MLSAAFTVDGTPVADGIVTVSDDTTVTLALVSVSGAQSVEWTCIGTHDPDVTPESITDAITPSGVPSGATAAFVVPAGAGQAYLIQAIVRGAGGRVDVRRGLVGVEDAAGHAPFAAGEEFERHPTNGWAGALNERLGFEGGGSADLPEATANQLLQHDGDEWEARSFLSLGSNPPDFGHLRIDPTGVTQFLTMRDASDATYAIVGHAGVAPIIVFGVFGENVNTRHTYLVAHEEARLVCQDAIVNADNLFEVEVNEQTVLESDGEETTIGSGENYLELLDNSMLLHDAAEDDVTSEDGWKLGSVDGSPVFLTTDGTRDRVVARGGDGVFIDRIRVHSIRENDSLSTVANIAPGNNKRIRVRVRLDAVRIDDDGSEGWMDDRVFLFKSDGAGLTAIMDANAIAAPTPSEWGSPSATTSVDAVSSSIVVTVQGVNSEEWQFTGEVTFEITDMVLTS